MADHSERELMQHIRDGDESAFARAYDLFHARARLAAWRVSHRPDWVDDILNEAWCRAFAQRKTYDPSRPFLVWIAGIIQNVYREHCRQSPLTLGDGPTGQRTARLTEEIDRFTPETLAAESELLAGLHDCVSRLPPEDARTVRLRYFDGKPLRLVAQELNVPESTLRDTRLPAILKALRRCMEKKGLKVPELFSAQGGGESQ